VINIDYDFILTCGGRLPEKFPQITSDNSKVLVRISNKTLLEHSLTALVKTNGFDIRSVVAVGPSSIKDELTRLNEILNPNFDLIYADEGTSLLDNIQIGMREIQRTNGVETGNNETENWHVPNSVIIISPDLPFITGEAISDFLARIPLDAEIAMPVVTKEAFLTRFPKAPNRFNKVLEGNITLGSVMLLSRKILKKNSGLFQDAHNSRKNVGKLAGMLGLSVLLKLLIGRLSIHEVEDKVSQLVDGTVHAVLDCDPVLAYDIDNAENLNYAMSVPFG
jgi:hypothetical protein